MKILILLVIFTAAAEAWVSKPPLGLDLYIPAPATNPITREKIALGRQLFFDKRLSHDGTLSCATCHDPKLSFSDGRTLVLDARAAGVAVGVVLLLLRVPLVVALVAAAVVVAGIRLVVG